MLLFDSYPTYNPYRVLVDRTPTLAPMKGQDVYALQDALNIDIDTGLILDGVLGPKTGAAIWKAQKRLGLVEDGKAGVLTQRALALQIIEAEQRLAVSQELTWGQIEHESSWLLGNYSPLRPNGTYDAGVCQENTEHYKPQDAFSPRVAIPTLMRQTKTAYDSYHDLTLFVGSDHSEFRRAQLSAGHWNAPAWANYLAGVKPWAVPSQANLLRFEEYMAEATTYLQP